MHHLRIIDGQEARDAYEEMWRAYLEEIDATELIDRFTDDEHDVDGHAANAAPGDETANWSSYPQELRSDFG